jgi:hypothetical protein
MDKKNVERASSPASQRRIISYVSRVEIYMRDVVWDAGERGCRGSGMDCMKSAKLDSHRSQKPPQSGELINDKLQQIMLKPIIYSIY